MNKPSLSSMEAYLRQMGMVPLPETPGDLEKEYYRQIYRVLPREQALSLPVRKARSKTSIKKSKEKDTPDRQ
ncbi:hypothetical protein ACTL6P_11840 [Endozoicomonas acroporae]|uniref:hypothetical protein n=1 Tax=Endozoicomonas TaxID=305899 RepID=UPI0011AEE946|nr:hypothetical protein [Endozoicomonas acroporae]